MKKVRTWCPGGGKPVRRPEVRGGHARCKVCGQRFLPREVRGAEGGESSELTVPPHKAY